MNYGRAAYLVMAVKATGVGLEVIGVSTFSEEQPTMCGDYVQCVLVSAGGGRYGDGVEEIARLVCDKRGWARHSKTWRAIARMWWDVVRVRDWRPPVELAEFAEECGWPRRGE